MKQNKIISKNLSFLQDKPNKKYSKKPVMNNLKAMIVPHAGLMFSGDLANEGYARVNWSQYGRILILSTHHGTGTFIPMSNEFQWNGNNYTFHHQELIGIIPQGNIAFEQEHSWLVQLPFLKKKNNITIILVNQYTESMFQAILNLIQKDTFVIANTDLLHCGTRYNINCPSNIEKFNQNTIRKIVNGEPLHHDELCGKKVIEMFQRLVFLKMWDYHNHRYISSDLIFPSNQSVGYTTILYTDFPLEELVRIPRMIMESEIVQSLLGQAISQKTFNDLLSILSITYPIMYQTYDYSFGIFVTIENERNQLRGCIGTFLQSNQLFRQISEMTLKSAFFDSRFFDNRITKSELQKLSYKVNFIGKPFIIFSMDQEELSTNLFSRIKSNLKVGLHGITLFFTTGRNATYLANVLIDSFFITKFTKPKWDILKASLAEKAESAGQIITKIELYECHEYDENYKK